MKRVLARLIVYAVIVAVIVGGVGIFGFATRINASGTTRRGGRKTALPYIRMGASH